MEDSVMQKIKPRALMSDKARADIVEVNPFDKIKTTPDACYQKILGQKEWLKLRPEIRARFSVKPALGQKIVFAGTMQVKYSFFGWLFAQFCRLIGTPLATRAGKAVPVIVTLAQNQQRGGIEWKREYFFTEKAETIASIKAVNAQGGLEEHVGLGFSMCLALKVLKGNLEFHSTAYRFRLGGFCINLPKIITPGDIIVKHEQVNNEFFRFTLEVNHPILGQTFFQTGIFS